MTTYKIGNVTVNKSGTEQSWRLVHDGDRVIDLFESSGYTETINQLFTGTRDECLAEISRLNLVELVSDEA